MTPALHWHLRHNLWPPCPTIMHPPAQEAIRACVAGDPDRSIPLPEGVTTREGETRTPAWELVGAYRLEWFVQEGDDTP